MKKNQRTITVRHPRGFIDLVFTPEQWEQMCTDAKAEGVTIHELVHARLLAASESDDEQSDPPSIHHQLDEGPDSGHGEITLD